MARKIQTYQPLENQTPPRPRGRQKHQQTSCSAAIRYHVRHSTESVFLREIPRYVAIKCVEETGETVECGAATRVDGHVGEGNQNQDDPDVSYWREFLSLEEI